VNRRGIETLGGEGAACAGRPAGPNTEKWVGARKHEMWMESRRGRRLTMAGILGICGGGKR